MRDPDTFRQTRRTALRYDAAGLAALGSVLGPTSGAGSRETPNRRPVYADTELERKTGRLHFHTGYSDGAPNSRPADAYAAGRNAGWDFMAVTEHSEWLPFPIETDEDCPDPIADRPTQDCVISPTDDRDGTRKWAGTREQARAESTDEYLGFRGFE